MKMKKSNILKLLPVFATLALSAHAQDIAPARASAVNPNGTHGLSRVFSAEGLGEGTVNLTLRAALYNQDNAYVGTTPLEGAQVTTSTLGAAIGLNRYFDLFGGASLYNVRQDGSAGSGFGSSFLGGKFNVPFAREQRMRMAVQLTGIFGTSKDQINTS